MLAVLSLGAGLGAGTAVAQVIPQSPDEPGFDMLPPPSLTFYGSPGLIDMPSGEMLPDGQFVTSFSYFGGQTRLNMTFQATPWLSATFRYNGIQNWNFGGFDTYYDRGFDVRFRLLKERKYRPAITLGLQDFAGTGIYAGEYIVATKNFAVPGFGDGMAGLSGRLKLNLGIGWGRLGSYGSIGSTGVRPAFVPGSTGGQLAYDQWFRGPFAPFGGIEWQPNDKLGFKVEYSSDNYVPETQITSVFIKKSPFNFGVEYQVTPRTRLGLYYLYGSEVGLNAQIQLSPKTAPVAMRMPAPQAIARRPSRHSDPAAWDTAWADSRAGSRAGRQAVAGKLQGGLAAALKADGLLLESLDITANSAELRFRNLRYGSFTNAVGRAARALAAVMPASVETFRLIPVQGGMALSAVTVRRSDLEALEYDPMSADALLAVAGIGDAPAMAETAMIPQDLYPSTSWSIAPYFSPSYFDPAQPIRLDAGVALRGSWRPAPGWVVAGTIRQRLAGNVKDGRGSNSALPHVRTDMVQYAQAGTTLNNLFVLRQWRVGPDLYGRVTVGYLEWMYGGISTELLWKPVASRLGLGVEANYVRQRDFDQRLSFRDYTVFTGHASAYYDFGKGYLGQVDVGRYLAGDVGATFSMDRMFDNGWQVGAFFTLTNVSAADFGEGSFDKGIRFAIPVGWFLGKPSRQRVGTTIRPIQRDGGQKLMVAGRLYGQVRQADRRALVSQWARVWE